MKLLARIERDSCAPQFRGRHPPRRTGARRRRGESRGAFSFGIHARCLRDFGFIQGLLQWSTILLPPEPLFDTCERAARRGSDFFRDCQPCSGGRVVAGDALGRRDLAFGRDRANPSCSGAARVLFDALDRRRYCLDRYLFRIDVAGRPRAAEIGVAIFNLRRTTGQGGQGWRCGPRIPAVSSVGL